MHTLSDAIIDIIGSENKLPDVNTNADVNTTPALFTDNLLAKYDHTINTG